LTGTSGHGLRAQFIENHAIVSGFVPGTLSGDGSEKEKDEMRVARGIASQQLGHARISVTASYYGSLRRSKTKDRDRLKNAVLEAIADLKEKNGEETLEEELREECKQIATVLLDDDVAITLSQVQTLWRRYCVRHNVEWKKPENMEEIKTGIYVAATMHRRWKEKAKRKGEDKGTGANAC
jgi:hypothetical protein